MTVQEGFRTSRVFAVTGGFSLEIDYRRQGDPCNRSKISLDSLSSTVNSPLRGSLRYFVSFSTIILCLSNQITSDRRGRDLYLPTQSVLGKSTCSVFGLRLTEFGLFCFVLFYTSSTI